MTRPISEVELSPLDQIRQTEAEVTRAIAAARQASEQIVADAQQKVKELKRQAGEDGLREGEVRYRELMVSAEEEVRTISAESHQRAKELRIRSRKRMEDGVNFAIQIVLGLEWEGMDA